MSMELALAPNVFVNYQGDKRTAHLFHVSGCDSDDFDISSGRDREIIQRSEQMKLLE